MELFLTTILEILCDTKIYQHYSHLEVRKAKENKSLSTCRLFPPMHVPLPPFNKKYFQHAYCYEFAEWWSTWFCATLLQVGKAKCMWTREVACFEHVFVQIPYAVVNWFSVLLAWWWAANMMCSITDASDSCLWWKFSMRHGPAGCW